MKYALALCSALLMVLIAIFPSQAIEGASSALTSWATVVVPSLMPFFIVSRLFLESGAAGAISRLLGPVTRRVFAMPDAFGYVFLSSMLGGYPLGAKLTADLYARGAVSRQEAQSLVCCTSTSGPLFIIGAVSVGMLGSASFAPYLLIPHYGAILLISAVAGRIFPRSAPRKTPRLASCTSIGDALASSVTSAVSSMLSVGGLMAVFSVALSCLWSLPVLPDGIFRCFFSGILEMTTGCIQSARLSDELRLVFLSGIISFGGLCVHAQTHAVCASSGLKLKWFSLVKLIHGMLAALLTWGALRLFPLSQATFALTPQKYGGPVLAGAAVLLCIAVVATIIRLVLQSRQK